MKEIPDAQKIRTKVMDCIETALFKDQTQEEKDRLLHMVSASVIIVALVGSLLRL